MKKEEYKIFIEEKFIESHTNIKIAHKRAKEILEERGLESITIFSVMTGYKTIITKNK